MTHALGLWAIAATAVVALDAVWLGILMRRFYSTRFAPIGRMSGGSMAPVWPAAAAVYVLLAVGVVAFALPRAEGLLMPAAGWGALLGLVVYGVYDLTNHATLAKWSPAVTIVDTAWGATLCAAVTVITTIAEHWIW
jgi:uncharacterized membrane protein